MIRPGVQRSTVAGPQKKKIQKKKRYEFGLRLMFNWSVAEKREDFKDQTRKIRKKS